MLQNQYIRFTQNQKKYHTTYFKHKILSVNKRFYFILTQLNKFDNLLFATSFLIFISQVNNQFFDIDRRYLYGTFYWFSILNTLFN